MGERSDRQKRVRYRHNEHGDTHSGFYYGRSFGPGNLQVHNDRHYWHADAGRLRLLSMADKEAGIERNKEEATLSPSLVAAEAAVSSEVERMMTLLFWGCLVSIWTLP